MHKTKTNTPIKETPNPKVPSGAVRPVIELTPNIKLTESLKPLKNGFTKSFKEALQKSEYYNK